MDKLKKAKHDHKLTDWLKFGIFALIMLAPFFSIGGRMAYTIFNKNAKDSYSGQKVEMVENSAYLLAHQNDRYYFEPKSNYRLYEGDTNITYYAYIYNVVVEGFSGNADLSTLNKLSVTIPTQYPATIYVYLYHDNTQLYTFSPGQATLNINFNLSALNGYNAIAQYNSSLMRYTEENTLDNAFDYSISKIAEEPVFNWVKNTAIYDGINAMFTGLDYDTDSNPIAIMCAYWLLNTAVYIVIDIVVWAFTKMTHMFVQE